LSSIFIDADAHSINVDFAIDHGNWKLCIPREIKKFIYMKRDFNYINVLFSYGKGCVL